MSNLYLPEGRLLHTPENQAAWETLSSLRQAMEQAVSYTHLTLPTKA